MALIRWTDIVGFTSWMVIVFCAASQTTNSCAPGWFGSVCQYKCRCQDNKCASNGVCTESSKCQKGWFGPACQYADLAYNMSILPEITDGDDDTCVLQTPRDKPGNISITLDQSYHFSWLRVHLLIPELMNRLRITFKSEDNDAEESCRNPRYSPIGETTMDIHCDMKRRFKIVTLLGEGTRYLCSVYISGGRNVALKHVLSTMCSVVEHDQETLLSPKGVSYGTYTTGRDESCENSFIQRKSPNLYVILPMPQHVTRYRLNLGSHPTFGYGRRQIELRSFNTSMLQAFHSTINVVDTVNTYTVVPVNVSSWPIHLVCVASLYRLEAMYMCDVQVFGDSACLPGRYGRDCEHRCNCAGGQPCLASTGWCPSGCAAGYLDFDCSKEPASRPQATAEIVFAAAAVLAGLVAIITVYHCAKSYRQNAAKLNTYDILHQTSSSGPQADTPGLPDTGYENSVLNASLNMRQDPTPEQVAHEDDVRTGSGYVDVSGSGYVDVSGSGYVDVSGSGYVDVSGSGYICVSGSSYVGVPESGYVGVPGSSYVGVSESGYIDVIESDYLHVSGSCTYSEQEVNCTTLSTENRAECL
ncbi:hypothetical protein BsWGS_23794 [Bradybaena similaris]